MADLQSNRERRLVILTGLVLILGIVVCYWPVRNFEYVNIDDQLYVYDNPMVERGLTWTGVAWAFHNVEGGNWNPLVWLSHMVDCQIYGKPAGGHHVTNVILHTANVLLLFLILRGMTGALWRSGLAAALFAWHPLHVESVVWISERKDVLSTLFWLLTMWAYAVYAREFKIQNSKSRVYYGLALVFFVLGLMSKPMLVTLPVVLLLMDWWPLKRICDLRFTIYGLKKDEPPGRAGESKAGTVSLFRAVMEKVPFLVLSLGAIMGAVLAQKSQGGMGTQGLFLRLENAPVSCVTYLAKLFWPARLVVFYPFPEAISLWRAGGAAAVLAVITVGVIWLGRERRYLVTGWLWFLITLLPVIGLVQVGKQAMADRYTYIPYMGLGLMASWGLADLAGARAGRRAVAAGFAIAALAGCIIVTRTQLEYWRNSKALFEHTLKIIPDNALAHYSLGNMLVDDKKYEEAAVHLQETIRLEPKNANAYNKLGIAYVSLHKMDDAMLMFSNAARLNPGFAQARWNLGNAYLVKGDTAKALAEMKAGVDLSPDDVEAHRRFGERLVRLGRAGEATPYFEMAVKARPQDAQAVFGLGEAYLARKRYEQATANFREAVRLAPENPQTLNALAWVYATSPQPNVRNGPEAVRLAEKACTLTKRQDVQDMDTLGAAYAEAARFGDAVKTAEETRALADALHDTEMVQTERQRLELYRAGKAYHEEP